MATPISRDILNRETNARFWAQSGYKVGQRLDPNNPLDKAKMPVWMDIFRKVTAEADAGALVTTYDHPEVAQQLSDAEVASTVAAVHVDAATKAPDPVTAQQHAAAAATAVQVSVQKLNEAAANQPPTVSSRLEEVAAREAAKTPPPPHAPAADQIAHAQMQNGQARNGQARNGQFLRPEDDPWDPRYVPKSKSPREQSSTQPAREVLTKETNNRFWLRTNYKSGQKLDMSIPEDRRQSKIWMEIFGEVQREANEGRLTFTNPELVPPPDGVRPPPSRPMPPRPMPPPPMQQPMPPPMQQPWPPPGMQRPMPPVMQQPLPGMQQPWPPLGMPRMPPGMQQPPMQRPMQQQPMQQPMQQSPMQQPMQQPPMQQPETDVDRLPLESERPLTEVDSTLTEPTTEGAPAETTGMSWGTIALIVLGAAGVTYAVTRKPAGRTVSFRPRAKSTMAATGAPSFAFPPSRGGRF